MNVPRFIRRLFRAPYDGLRHFGVVAEGRLYRCGQPRPDELRDLIQRHGLRTVVSLRGSRDADDPDSWQQAEAAVCEAAGISFVTIPCNHRNPPDVEQARQFLNLFREPARMPVLVHCRLGQQRTLLFCGLYRVHMEGQDPETAEQEMDALGFGAHNPRHAELLTAFRRLARQPVLSAAAV